MKAVGKCLTLIVGFCLLASCSDKTESLPTRPKSKQTAVVIRADAHAPLEYVSVGSVVSDQRVEVASRITGYLRELRVKEGDEVKAGQLLAFIDASDVEGAIRQARAKESAAEAAMRDADTDVKHYKQLYQQRSISDNEYRKIRLRQESAAEDLNQAKAALATAIAQRDYTQIRSPFDANVVALPVRVGDLVLPGKPLLTLESGADLIFDTNVPERELPYIKPGMPVTLHLDAVPAPLHGKVSRIVRSGDPVTRSYPIKISLPKDSKLMPGMFGRAVFPLGQANTLMLPKKVLVERGGLQGVFVVDNKNNAWFRWLRLGREWPDNVEITDGLEPGQRIVASDLDRMRDGTHILVRDQGSTKQ